MDEMTPNSFTKGFIVGATCVIVIIGVVFLVQLPPTNKKEDVSNTIIKVESDPGINIGYSNLLFELRKQLVDPDSLQIEETYYSDKDAYLGAFSMIIKFTTTDSYGNNTHGAAFGSFVGDGTLIGDLRILSGQSAVEYFDTMTGYWNDFLSRKRYKFSN